MLEKTLPELTPAQMAKAEDLISSVVQSALSYDEAVTLAALSNKARVAAQAFRAGVAVLTATDPSSCAQRPELS